MKDGFRRFGGTFQGNDGGNLTIILVGVVGLLIFCVLAFTLNNAYLVIAGFMVLFLFSCISLFFKGGETANLKTELHYEYINAAVSHFENQEYSKALVCFNKALRYGSIPENVAGIYNETVSKTKSA